MNNEKQIEALNTLIEINNDRIEGYTTAAKEAKETDLKMLFSENRDTSVKNKNELSNEVKKLGGKPIEDTRTTGKLYRAWMDIKAALVKEDRKAIIGSCEFGEDIAVKTYNDVLKNEAEHLSPNLHKIINEQRIAVKSEHDKIRNLRDAMQSK